MAFWNKWVPKGLKKPKPNLSSDQDMPELLTTIFLAFDEAKVNIDYAQRGFVNTSFSLVKKHLDNMAGEIAFLRIDLEKYAHVHGYAQTRNVIGALQDHLAKRENTKEWWDRCETLLRQMKGSVKTLLKDAEVSRSRRTVLKAGAAAATAGVIGTFGAMGMRDSPQASMQQVPKEAMMPTMPPAVLHKYAQISPPSRHYLPQLPEIDFSLLRFSPFESMEGRVQYAYRWKEVCDAVELRYGIPSGILIGMICKESYGGIAVINRKVEKTIRKIDGKRKEEVVSRSGDGGAGLIHMQPKLSTEYGLQMITVSEKLRDFDQGERFFALIRERGPDLRRLWNEDDRFHPIINIDAAARMLADEYLAIKQYFLSQKKGFPDEESLWVIALRKYSGRPFEQYGEYVVNVASNLHDPSFMQGVREKFNELNATIDINGNPLAKGENDPRRPPITFPHYLLWARNMSMNFGLAEYVKLKKYHVSYMLASRTTALRPS